MDFCKGLIFGCAVGDAKGIPFENQTKEEIAKKLTREDNGEPYLICGKENPYIEEGYGPGKWTDDTQLTLAMMRALTKSNGKWDMDTIADAHVEEYKRSLAGWGGTRTCIQRLMEKTHTYLNSGNPATGNGVLMKLSSVSYYFVHANIDLSEQVKNLEVLCRMTHNTPVAVITCLVMNHFMSSIFKRPEILGNKDEIKTLLVDLVKLAENLDKKFIQDQDEKIENTPVGPRLKRMLKMLDVLEDDSQLLDLSQGGTFFCLNSMIMVIGIIVSGDGTFNDVVRACYIGGDTDSNASMVSAILGGVNGTKFIPKEYLSENLYGKDELEQTAIQYSRLFQ